MKKYISLPNIILLAIIIFNIILVNIPLLSTFNYEFSIVNGIVMSYLFGLAALHFLRRNQKTVKIIFEKKYYFGLSLLLPLLIASFKAVLFPECPVLDGYLFYLVITVPSVIFSLSIAVIISLFSKKKIIYLNYSLLFITYLLIPIYIEFYFNPQLYFYNPFIGYFPGTIYDENIPIDLKLVLYRIIIIIIAVLNFLLAYFFSKILKKIKFLAFVLSLLVYVFFFSFKSELGFSTSSKTLYKTLNKHIITPHFIINYPKLHNSINPYLLAVKHEYYFHEISRELEINFDKKITSFIFADKEQKRKLIGAGNADVAKPWLNQIYINIHDINTTLKHELLHIISGHFGSTPFKVAAGFSPALIEGIATAFENNFDDYPVHTIAKIAYEAGYRINLVKLFSGLNFFASYSSLAYVYAGSFIRFISEKYNIETVKEIYHDADFKKHTGKSIEELEKDYIKFLKSIDYGFNPYTAQLYFAGLTVFKKYCVRTAARQLSSAYRMYNEGNYYSSSSLFKNIYDYSNSYSALHGYINSLYKLNMPEKANEIIKSQINNFKQSQYYFNLQLNLADSYQLCENSNSANSIFDSVIGESPNYLYESFASFGKEINNYAGYHYKDFLFGSTKEKFSIIFDIYEKSRNKALIPLLMQYSENSDSISAKIKTVFFNNFKVTDQQSSYCALLLSRYFINNMDFNTAKYFGVISLEYKKNNFLRDVLVENLKMINWLINFYNDAAKQIRIIDSK